jgi:hypothetical protein
VAAAQVLYEGVPGRNGAQRGQAFESAHRPQPRLEPAVVGLDHVVRVSLGDMPRRRELVEQPRVDRCPVGGDLDRGEPEPQRAGEERACGGRIPASGQEDVDHLAVLVDRPVQVGPAAGDLHVRFVNEPPVPSRMPYRASGVDERWRERLHPPIDRHMVDLDAALG